MKIDSRIDKIKKKLHKSVRSNGQYDRILFVGRDICVITFWATIPTPLILLVVRSHQTQNLPAQVQLLMTQVCDVMHGTWGDVLVHM
jgi:hypothetical protein